MSGLNASENLFSRVNFYYLIMGAEFNSETKRKTLGKMKNSVTIGDCFSLPKRAISHLENPAMVYDLSHALGYYLPEFPVSDNINSTKKEVFHGDFIISRLRSYLREMAIVHKRENRQVVSSEFFVLRAKKNARIPAAALLPICSSRHVQTILELSQYGTEHPRFYDFALMDIPLPEAVISISEKIAKLAARANFIFQNSEAVYKHAESLLLSELGLNKRQPDNNNISIAKFGEMPERWDAEYYMPKHDEANLWIRNCPYGYDVLEDVAPVIGHPPNPPYFDEGEVPIVVQKHLSDVFLERSRVLAGDTKYTTKEFAAKNTDFVLRQNDLVLYTVGGPPHIGKANMALDDMGLSTIGSFVTLVRLDAVKASPFVMLVFLNSPIGMCLTNRFQRGMVQKYIYPRDLANTLIPRVSKSIERKITKQVLAAYRHREEAKNLINLAKFAVETAIEKGEKAAFQILEQGRK